MTARWRAAGLVAVGKSATSEFGLNVSTESRQHGATRNPWHGDFSAGGSSGGGAGAGAPPRRGRTGEEKPEAQAPKRQLCASFCFKKKKKIALYSQNVNTTALSNTIRP